LIVVPDTDGAELVAASKEIVPEVHLYSFISTEELPVAPLNVTVIDDTDAADRIYAESIPRIDALYWAQPLAAHRESVPPWLTLDIFTLLFVELFSTSKSPAFVTVMGTTQVVAAAVPQVAASFVV
jgi:hypothetical protein